MTSLRSISCRFMLNCHSQQQAIPPDQTQETKSVDLLFKEFDLNAKLMPLFWYMRES